MAPAFNLSSTHSSPMGARPLLPTASRDQAYSISPGGSRRGSMGTESSIGDEQGRLSNSHSPLRGTYGSARSARSASASTLGPPEQMTVSEKFTLPAWETDMMTEPEDDDWLHNPNPKRDRKHDEGGSIFTVRGVTNLGCMFVLVLSILMLFAGYPILSYYQNIALQVRTGHSIAWEWDLAKINGSLSRHDPIPGRATRTSSAIDPDTPEDKKSIVTSKGETWDLVFSDEFEQDGRTFYAGDDPYWESIDLHAWSTNDLEWYDSRRVTTQDGALRITMSNETDHGLYFQSAEIQSWNKMCFMGGRLEVAARLPGRADIPGNWPALWTMGNLGRPGYGGSTDGLWPYSYNSCDAGAAPNQTINSLPTIATTSGWNSEPYNGALSYLPGQRLSRCVCSDEYHPGPKNSDGSWVGRSAPEIDLIEAQVSNGVGEVSQSVQYAPFNAYYGWNTPIGMEIFDTTVTKLNSYSGGPYQQACSGVTNTNSDCYQYGGTGCFSMFAFEYKMGDDGYITWFNDNKLAWTYHTQGMAVNTTSQVSQRPIPYEPMYVIINLAISHSFSAIDFEGLSSLWPAIYEIDYVRLYQDTSEGSTHYFGCDPPSAPTSEYINRYLEAYTNPNITTWDQLTGSSKFPRNSLAGDC